MDVVVSGRPGDGGSAGYADLAVVAPFGVVLLDGASAFAPVDVDAATYARTLGTNIAARLSARPAMSVADAVADAIRRTAATLDLTAGASPSSAVAVLRVRADVADLYVLGDTQIHYGGAGGTHRLVDDRLSGVALPERDHYVARLRAGHGYDDAHRRALVALQQAQRRARNVDGGYWIAGTDPAAAHHGLTVGVDRDAVEWAVLATDGAADLIDHTDHDWRAVAGYDRRRIDELLAELHAWEADRDPDGRELPRAKRHDDKTIAAVRDIWT